ncbi:MAG: methyltransferase domain-containing protein [Myxococcaceae bacterium]|nr:methyltransferase domain-containing protein [Myxococcaceae bacterium]
MSDGYIHGATSAREVARLEKQGDWTAAFTFPGFGARPGERVVDLACGVGAMSSRLASQFDGLRLVGVDLSATQLAACRENHPTIPVLRADATRLPFPDGSIDKVFCSWLLEHVASPVAVLREVRRVLKPGGVCQFVEVDNFSFVTRPHLPAAHEALRLLNAAQLRAGGDPGIGPRLHHAFLVAGFRRFTLEPVVLHGTHARPDFLGAFIDEFVEIFESVEGALGDEGRAVLDAAIAELRGLRQQPSAELTYTPVLARGFR